MNESRTAQGLLKYTDEERSKMILERDEYDRLTAIKNAYDDALYAVKEYTNGTKEYYDYHAKYVDGKYEEIANTISVKTEDWCNKSLSEIKDSITTQAKYLNQYKKIYKDTGNEVADDNAKQAQKNLEDLAANLKDRTKTVGDLGNEEVEAWKTLANNSYEVYSQKINEMPPEMQKKIQELTSEIVYGTSSAENASRVLAIRVTNQLEKSTEARQSALETLKGFMNGLTDDEQQELLKQAGVKDVEKVMKGLKEGNLSEEQGKNVLKGILSGLSDENWNSQLKTKASGLAKQLSGLLTITPTIGAVQGASQALATIQAIQQKASGHADGLAYVPYNNYVARLHEGERVLSKKENAEYIRNNISNKNSRSVTVNIYPQTMTEGEMHKISRFVDREWGGRN